MATRHKCLARNNKSGTVQSDARLGTSDEPVQALARRTGQKGSERVTARSMGAFATKQSPVQRSRPPDGSVGTNPTMVESNKMLAGRLRNGTGIDRH
jgi:hypothetical protein